MTWSNAFYLYRNMEIYVYSAVKYYPEIASGVAGAFV